MNRDLIAAAIFVLAIFGITSFLFVGIPFITGSTFGQRCAKAYPEDLAQQEWCIKRLEKGGTVYPKPASLECPHE